MSKIVDENYLCNEISLDKSKTFFEQPIKNVDIKQKNNKKIPKNVNEFRSLYSPNDKDNKNVKLNLESVIDKAKKEIEPLIKVKKRDVFKRKRESSNQNNRESLKKVKNEKTNISFDDNKEVLAEITTNGMIDLIKACDYTQEPKFYPLESLKNVEKNLIESSIRLNEKPSDMQGEYGKYIIKHNQKIKFYNPTVKSELDKKVEESMKEECISEHKNDELITEKDIIPEANAVFSSLNNTSRCIINQQEKRIMEQNNKGMNHLFFKNIELLTVCDVNEELRERDPANPNEFPCINAGQIGSNDSSFEYDEKRNKCRCFRDWGFVGKSLNYQSDKYNGRLGQERRACYYCIAYEVTNLAFAAKSSHQFNMDMVIQPLALVTSTENGYNNKYMIPQHSTYIGLVNAFKVHCKDDYVYVKDKKKSKNNKIYLRGLIEDKKLFFHQ